MADTSEDRGRGAKWHWDNVRADLRRAGLDLTVVERAEPLTDAEYER